MQLRKIIFLALVVSILALGIFALSPVKTANACLPCFCFNDPIQPINCYGKYSVFAIPRADYPGFDIQILTLDAKGNGRQVIYVTAEALDRLPEKPEAHLLIAKWRNIYLYKLSYGDYQVNVGPNDEGNIDVLIFSSGDAHRIQESGYRP